MTLELRHPWRVLPANSISLFVAIALPFVCAAGAETVFTSNTAIEAGDTAYEGQDIVVNGCTLTVNGAHAFNSLMLTNNGVLTHSGFSLTTEPRINLIITQAMVIAASGRIDATGKGYLGAMQGTNATSVGMTSGGTTNGGSTGLSGGSYGGLGGSAGFSSPLSTPGVAAATYGNASDPSEPGAGGASYFIPRIPVFS